jgi:hypothetical protein
MYYRIAIQRSELPIWQWESHVITSLDTVYQILTLYSTMPRDHIRVFFSSSVACLDEMLAHENQGLATYSVTAEELSHMSKHLPTGEMQQFYESICAPNLGMGTAVISLLAAHIWDMQGQQVPDEERTHALEMRRFAGECEAGTDYDIPYTFTLPNSLPQVLTLARLLARVKRGELEP